MKSPGAADYAKILHPLQAAVMVPRGALSFLTFVSFFSRVLIITPCLTRTYMPGTLGDAFLCTRFQMTVAEESHGSLGGLGWPGRIHCVSCLYEAGGTSMISLLVDNSPSAVKLLPDGHLQTKYLVYEPIRWHERIRITWSRVTSPSQSTAKLSNLFQEIMDTFQPA